MGQERWISHEEHRERGEADIRHRVIVIPWRFAPVGQTGANLAQFGNQRLQGVHQATESTFAPRRQAKSVLPWDRAEEIHGLLPIGLGHALAGAIRGATDARRSRLELLVAVGRTLPRCAA